MIDIFPYRRKGGLHWKSLGFQDIGLRKVHFRREPSTPGKNQRRKSPEAFLNGSISSDLMIFFESATRARLVDLTKYRVASLTL